MIRIFVLVLFGFMAAKPARAMDLAITVDDLPAHGDLTPDQSRMDLTRNLIAVFKKHGLNEVYGFTNGALLANSKFNPQVLREWVGAGFPLGNHTWSHPDFSKITLAEYIEETRKNEEAVASFNAPGMDFKYFRYPFLSEGDTLEKRNGFRKYLADSGYQIAQVSYDFNDWAWNEPYVRCFKAGNDAAIQTLEKQYMDTALARLDYSSKISKLMFRRDVKQILLMHAGVFSSRMLDRLLTAYEKAGVHFITLKEALADDVYKTQTDFVSADGLDFLEQIKESREIDELASPEPPLADLEKTCL